MKELLIAEKLNEHRNTAMQLLNSQYTTRIKVYTDIIQAVMKANKCNASESLLMIAKTEMFADSDYTKLMFFAGCAEVIINQK